MTHWLLTILIFLPVLGAVGVLLADASLARGLALSTTILTFAASLLLLAVYDFHAGTTYGYAENGGTVQLVQRVDWIASFHIQYLVGIDGLSIPLVLLTTLIFLLATVASWTINTAVRGYFALFLLLEAGVLGTFLSLDLFLFYVFFEFTLVPMYFLIGVWGGPKRQYAAIKFFIYTLIGSVGLLIVLISTFLYTRSVPLAMQQSLGIVGGTFDLVKLASPAVHAALGAAGQTFVASKILFVLAMSCFLVKVPAVPLHTWLPDAHVEAPTPISMLLAALLLKMGGYGIFRVALPLYPDAAKSLWLLFAVVGVVSLLYGALCAMSQTDFKRLVAYSSVSHMGLVVLGAAVMTPTSMNGAIFMMIAHGIISAMLFFIVGVIYDRAHHREMSRLGGILAPMPVYTGLANVGFFANLGLPLLCGFVGEVMVIFGTFEAAGRESLLVNAGLASSRSMIVFAVLACSAMILTAGYMLWMIQRVYLGPTRPEHSLLPDANAREIGVLAPLAILTLVLGVLPWATVLVFTEPFVSSLLKILSVGR